VRAKAIATLLVATALVALPAGAAGATRHYRQPAGTGAEIHLRGTHGFNFMLLAEDQRLVLLSASKEISKIGDENVTYFSRDHTPSVADLEGGDLNVRIGRLGSFRAHFVARSTKTEPVGPGCKGEPTTVEKGFFVGSMDFRGERGYSSVHAQRARGTITRTGAARCVIRFPPSGSGHESARHAKEEKKREENAFRFLAGDSTADTIFQATREEAPAELGISPTTFTASVTSKVGDLAVSHSAFVFDFRSDAGATFLTPNLAEPLAEATLQPPAPFSGAATFDLQDPKTASWTGDLAVELPGLSPVALTGDGINAGLCKGRSNCTRTLPPRLASILEATANSSSGSGSYFVGASYGP
jgi:hypothetical protein